MMTTIRRISVIGTQVGRKNVAAARFWSCGIITTTSFCRVGLLVRPASSETADSIIGGCDVYGAKQRHSFCTPGLPT